MNSTQLTATEAIEKLEKAISFGNKKEMLELISPDDPNSFPDWDDEPDYLWEEWDGLVEKSKQILGI